MPRLEAIGRVEDVESLDFDPIIIPVIGYTEDKEEVEFEAYFRPFEPTGQALNVLRVMDQDGDVPAKVAIAYLDACILAGHQDAWREFLDRPDVYVHQDTLVGLYKTIVEFYTARPTSQPSDSPTGPGQHGKTSRAAASSKGSTSRASR